MKRFNAACGWAVLLLIGLAGVSGSQGGNIDRFAPAMAIVMVVWVLVTVGASLYRPGAAATRAARNGPQAGGHRQAGPKQRLSPDLIERLCRETGVVFVSREADRYEVRNGDHASTRYISVWYSDRFTNVMFQSWFPIQFSLEQEPKGLFARVLLRNGQLHWSGWSMAIGGSCEACLTLVANVPPSALDAHLFASVCGEMVAEINAFHQELHDKFRYAAGGRMVDASPCEIRDMLDNVQVRESLPNGPVRYRLPRS
jgi:hypothetical protein